jgi:hypothetical protein
MIIPATRVRRRLRMMFARAGREGSQTGYVLANRVTARDMNAHRNRDHPWMLSTVPVLKLVDILPEIPPKH